jgi:uncharacterized protein DUF4432
MPESVGFDTSKFIHPSQAGGIDAYTIDEGTARGVRALLVNTGGGLRYRILVDRGLDIDQAFFNQHSLSFLTHKGVTPPTRALDHNLDWLQSFPGGLLTSCGPFNIGPPGKDGDEDLGLHGPHSNTAATLESVSQPDPHAGKLDMTVVGSLRYGAFYGPCLQLRRTLHSTLGSNAIEVTDEFTNAGNQPVPHAWLLHINFGYPLVDAGSELCFDSPKVIPTDAIESVKRFRDGVNYKKILPPQESHRGPDSAVAYLFPKPADRAGNVTVGIVNPKLNLGVAIRYSARQFPRCGNWQHFGPREYVTALEPMNGTIDGRATDRANKLLDFIQPGAKKIYRYMIEAVTSREGLGQLRALNR